MIIYIKSILEFTSFKIKYILWNYRLNVKSLGYNYTQRSVSPYAELETGPKLGSTNRETSDKELFGLMNWVAEGDSCKIVAWRVAKTQE